MEGDLGELEPKPALGNVPPAESTVPSPSPSAPLLFTSLLDKDRVISCGPERRFLDMAIPSEDERCYMFTRHYVTAYSQKDA